MDNIELYDELIEKFLAGKMTPEEEKSFKEELISNQELKEHAKVVSSLVKGMKRKKEKGDAAIIEETINHVGFHGTAARIPAACIPVASIRDGHGGSTPTTPSRGKVIKFILWPISIAAVCVLMFNLFISNGDKGGELFENFYSEYSCETLSRGDEDSLVVAKLSELFNGIKEHEDCSSIVKSLETIYKSLDKEYKYRSYANDIAWYLALAYIKNNQMLEAEKVLAKLVVDNPDTGIADRAQKLLKDMKEIK